MARFEIKCGDGTDRHCSGVVEVSSLGIDENVLTEAQKAYIEECLEDFNESDDEDDPLIIMLDITKDQARKIGIEVTDEELNDGFYEYPLEIHREFCSACGSDQVYDDEGNNI
jgi:hypothetical protein